MNIRVKTGNKRRGQTLWKIVLVTMSMAALALTIHALFSWNGEWYEERSMLFGDTTRLAYVSTEKTISVSIRYYHTDELARQQDSHIVLSQVEAEQALHDAINDSGYFDFYAGNIPSNIIFSGHVLSASRYLLASIYLFFFFMSLLAVILCWRRCKIVNSPEI